MPLRDIHCHKVGYSKPQQRSRATAISPAPLAMLPAVNTVVPPFEGNVHAPAISVAPLRSHGPCKDAVPMAFAPPSVHSTPATARTDVVAPGAPTGYSRAGMQAMQISQTSSTSMADTDLAEARKRKNGDTVLMTPYKRQATHDLAAGSSSMNSNDQVSKKNLAVHLKLLCRCIL